MASPGKFSCDGCGKTYSWKTELAGKRVKCKCAQVLTVPAEDPALADAPPEGFEDLYALSEGAAVVQAVTPPAFSRGGTPCPSCGANVETDAVICVSCGHNMKTGKKLKTKASGAGGGAGRGAPALAGAGGGSAMLGYASMAPKRYGNDGERSQDVFFHPVKDLYIPGAMIVVGSIISFLVTFSEIHSVGISLLAVGILTFINIILVVPAVLLCVKLFDLGIGPIGPGILKIIACAVAPGAFGELIGMIFHGTIGGYIGWIISLGITITIFMKLLDMDFMEVLICSAIIFVIRTWLVIFLTTALLSSLGLGSYAVAGMAAAGGGGGGKVTLSGAVDRDEDESLDGPRARESDEAATQMLLGGGVEGKDWLQKNPTGVLAGKTREKSEKILRGIYAAGALEIRVYPHKNAKNIDMVNQFIIAPPRPEAAGSKEIRARVMKELKALASDLGRATPRDKGEKYWLVEMLTEEEWEKQFAPPSFPSTPPGTKPGTKQDPDDDDDN